MTLCLGDIGLCSLFQLTVMYSLKCMQAEHQPSTVTAQICEHVRISLTMEFGSGLRIEGKGFMELRDVGDGKA